jgi:hypothetical protein
MSNSVNGSAGDIYYTTSGTDPRAAFGAVASGATPGADEVNINISQVTTVKARVLNNGTWSPMAEYTFYPPQPFENLVINEIHYNPIPPVGMSPSDYEFVELYNKGTTPLRLDNVSFSRGISYRFPVNTRLEPGKYIVLVSEPAAFKTRYNLTASGSYRGNLSNDGEAIEIIDAVGNVIDFVDYKVAAPWPTAPNGGGTSLSLARNDLDNSQAWVWGASLSNGGTPNAANGDIPVASPPPTPIQKRIFLPSVGR